MLLAVIRLLQRRVDANKLLPGTIREEELDYDAHVQAAVMKAKNKPVLSPTVLRAAASTMGYVTLVGAMFSSLNMLSQPLWPATQKRMVASFVLQGLDVIPLTVGIPAGWVPAEQNLVDIIEQHITMVPLFVQPYFASGVRIQ